MSTVPSFVSPTTLYVKTTSDAGADVAVIVYVKEEPSATLLPEADTEYPIEPVESEAPETVPEPPSEIVEPLGSDATPIPAASCAYVF